MVNNVKYYKLRKWWCLILKSKSLQLDRTGLNTRTSKLSFGILHQVSVFAISLIIANVKVLGILSPFGIAFTAAMPLGFFHISFIGSIIGYALFGSIVDNIPNMISLTVLIAFKLIVTPYIQKRKDVISILSLFSFGIVMIVNLVQSLIGGFTLLNLIMGLSESFLVGAMTYFCGITVRCINSRRSLVHFNMFEKCSIVIVSGILILSLCNIQFFYLNIGKILSVILVLSMSYKLGMVGGAITGIILAISMTLYSPDLVIMSGTLIVAGFISGIFNQFGKLLIVSVFIIINAVSFVLLQSEMMILANILDMLFGVAVFMFIPDRIYDRCIISTGAKNTGVSIQAKNDISSKLDFASKAIADLQNSVETVSKKIDSNRSDNLNSVIYRVTDNICKNCSLNMICWDKHYNDTMEAITKAISVLTEKGIISSNDLPDYFERRCCKSDVLLEDINRNYEKFIISEGANRRVTEVRNVAIEQFEAMSEILCDISKEINEVSCFDDKLSGLIKQIFENNGYSPKQVSCSTDKYGRVCIDIYLEDEFLCDLKLINSQLSDMMQREFDIPSIITVGKETKISFFECANFRVDFSAMQYSSEDNEVCGDSYEYFLDSKGFAHIILSDGMGSGKSAAVDSVMTCTLVLKLIKAGFGFESILKLINSSLIVKSKEESISTLDILTIDLYTGKAYFNKAGAAMSFVFKNNKTLRVKSESLPIGILKGINFDKKTFSVLNNNIIVMVSDGVISTGVEWIEAEIELNCKKSSKQIASVICKEARRRLHAQKQDDITILVSKIKHKGIM